MELPEIIKALGHLRAGVQFEPLTLRAIYDAAIAELESLDLTPEQRAERRLREATRSWAVGSSIVEDRLRGRWVAYVKGCEGDISASCSASTPDEAVDRLLARVK